MQIHELEIEAEQEETIKNTIADLNPGDWVEATFRNIDYENDAELDGPFIIDAIVTDTRAGGKVLHFERIEFTSGPWEDTQYVCTFAQKPAVFQAYYPDRSSPHTPVNLAVVEDIEVVGFPEPNHDEVVQNA